MIFKKNYIYYTVLHYACFKGDFKLVQYIISLNQIDLKAKNIFT